MPAQILFTKLYFPSPRQNTVARSRLTGRLNEGLLRKLILISAPAGFGKTTLVSEWAASSGKAVAWLSLDEGDSEPTRFLTYFIAALQRIAADIGKGVLVIIESPQLPPIETILTALLNEIVTIQDHFVLVLDDYHVIDSRLVDDALAFLLEHLPPQMHLVIASREDPHLPLARYRARGQLTELRSVDLRFTPGEAAEFLNRVMGLSLSEEDVAALDNRTEGWIAGLQLAALSMQGQPQPTSFIQSFTGSHRFVLDYLMEEVLHQQSDSIQSFLLRTSMLDRLCGSLCDAVVESPFTSGQEALEDLERDNLFLIPLDNERRWYRYHHLFGDILRQRLGQKRSPAEIAEDHLRASVWFEKNGDEAESIQHALAARDFARAAELVESAWQGMDGTFQSAAWLGWAKKLPVEVLRVRPVLLTHMAQAFMDAGEPEASESCLQDAERCLNGLTGAFIVVDETQLGPLPAVIAMTRSYNAQVQGDLAGTVKYAERALQLIPEDDFFRRAQATIMLEVTHWTRGDLDAAREALGDWMNNIRKAGNIIFLVASAFAMADIQVAQGCLREAIQTYQQAIQLAAENGPDAQHITAHHYLGLALLRHEMGENAAAAEYLQKAEEIGKQTTLVDWSYRWNIAQARLKESVGELESALVHLDEARRMYVKTLIPDVHPVEALKAKIYLKQGRFDKALDWVHVRGMSADDEISYLGEFEHLTLARVLMAEFLSSQDRGSLLDAIGLLERLLKAAEAQRRTGSIVEILVAQALAYQAQGELPLALVTLERALILAEPEGYVMLFVGEGEPMRLLLEKISRNPDHRPTGYVNKLLSFFRQSVGATPNSKIKNLKSEIVEPLSERELEVLKLLRTELSGPEIACQLVVSPNTFRTHTKNIFSKLGVNNRRAAVRRAEELDLI